MRKYRGDGLPMARHGKYDPVAVVAWFARHEAEKALKYQKKKVVTDEKRLVIARAEKIEMENAVRRGELVPFDDVNALVLHLCTLMANSLEGLAARMASILAAIDDPAQVQAELHAEARSVRRLMADQIEKTDMGLIAAQAGGDVQDN
jgi:phage terminase Nu1 subunit (DNA packaging protein)